MFNRNKTVTESLRLQLEILRMMQVRHVMWADAIDDPETTRIHSKSAELIQKTIQQINGLFDRYNVPLEPDEAMER